MIVTLNAFVSDTEEERAYVEEYAREKGCEFSYSRAWEKGGEGALDLAEKILDILSEDKADFRYLYPDDMPVREKIETVACRIYGASGVEFSSKALAELKNIEEAGGDYPVCMAKTQYSFSDDPSLLGAPEGFTLKVRDVYLLQIETL